MLWFPLQAVLPKLSRVPVVEMLGAPSGTRGSSSSRGWTGLLPELWGAVSARTQSFSFFCFFFFGASSSEVELESEDEEESSFFFVFFFVFFV